MATLEVPTFYPTWEEFQDFSAYIASIEDEATRAAGIAKVVPPPEWNGFGRRPPPTFPIHSPIRQQVVRGPEQGVYQLFPMIEKKVMTCEEFAGTVAQEADFQVN